MWGNKHDTISAIAEHGWFDVEGEEDEDETSGRPSREQESVALLPPEIPRKNSKRRKVERRRGVSNLPKLLERYCTKEEPKYDIFGKHLQSERAYSQNKNLGFQYTTPGLEEAPVVRTVLDQNQQEAIERFRSPPPPADFGIEGRAAGQVRRARQNTNAKHAPKDPLCRDFAQGAGRSGKSKARGAEALFDALLASKRINHTPGSAISAVHEAQQETLDLARAAENPVATAKQIDHAAAEALSAKHDQPQSFFEQGTSVKTALLAKVKSFRKHQAQGREPDRNPSICRLKSKALTLKLKQSLSIHRHPHAKPCEKTRAQAEAQGQATAHAKLQAKARALEFEAEKDKLLHEIHVARRLKHQRWLEAESEMARAQDRPPNPIPPMQPISLHDDLQSDAQIHATSLDAAFDSTPTTKWRANSQLTTITTSKRNGNIRITSPPNHGILCLCNMWLDQGHTLREKALQHMTLIQQGHFPPDHLRSGCDCYLYRIYEAFTNNHFQYIGIAQTQKEQAEEYGKGRWVIYLAKETPISKLLLGSQLPSTKVRRVPARRPTSANRPRPLSARIMNQVRRRSMHGLVYFANNPLRDVRDI